MAFKVQVCVPFPAFHPRLEYLSRQVKELACLFLGHFNDREFPSYWCGARRSVPELFLQREKLRVPWEETDWFLCGPGRGGRKKIRHNWSAIRDRGHGNVQWVLQEKVSLGTGGRQGLRQCLYSICGSAY